MSEAIETIKERISLDELVGEYVSLRRAGTHFKGLCPFHQEKTPSFIVSPAKGIWHCFGCGEGGDVFGFVQKIEGIDFPAALKFLAERAGVELPRPALAHERTERQRLFETLALATRFYHELLVHQAVGKPALAYLQKRGVTIDTVRLFQLGWAPPTWDSLQRFLRQKNIAVADMITVGLVGRSAQGKLFDRFRGRILFPIHDVQGRVVAFGGRITPFTETGNEGKYINSPETKLYSKRHVVYNLQRAKQALRHNQPCIVVEGYMDVVMLVQAGLHSVVASSGTAFTAEHITQLSRFTDTLHFAFDADAAGFKAAFSATEQALTAGLKVATIALPPGKDPADVALETPTAALALFHQPRSLLSLLFDRFRQQKPAETEQYYQDLLPLIGRVANPIQQGEMVQELAQRLHVPEQRIMTLVEQHRGTPAYSPAAPLLFGVTIKPEQYVVGLLLFSSEARQLLWPLFNETLLLDDAMRALYKALQDLARNHDEFLTMAPDDLIAALPSQFVPVAEGVRVVAQEQAHQSSWSLTEQAAELLRFLKRRWLTHRLRELQHSLGSSSPAERPALLQEFQQTAEALEQTKA